MKKIELVTPDQASPEVSDIFDDIRATKGNDYLTPTWGFFGLDVELLRHWWGLTKRLQMTEGDVPKAVLNSISLVCAAEANCPRCINNHQIHLTKHFGLDQEFVDDVLDFERSERIPDSQKAALRFARKVVFQEDVTVDDFQNLRRHGYTDRGIAEIVSMAMLESSMARHAVGVAQFENGDEWPRENTPSSTYAENVNA